MENNKNNKIKKNTRNKTATAEDLNNVLVRGSLYDRQTKGCLE